MVIVISNRKGKKLLTTVTGFENLKDVHLKDTAKKIGKKFATGATAKDNTIEMQGDMAEALIEWIPANIKEVTTLIY